MADRYLQPVMLALMFVLNLAGCDVSEQENQAVRQPVHISGPTMGTWYSVTVIPPDANLDTTVLSSELSSDINQLLASLNKLMSTYDPASELSRFNQSAAGTEFTFSKDTAAVLRMALELSVRSDGAFDVTVGPVVNLWGFGPNGRFKKKPDSETLALALKRVGYQYLQWTGENTIVKRGPVYVDLSAIAKGYAVDKVAELLVEKGYHRYLVDIGGELKAGAPKAEHINWNVAVEQPVAGERAVQKVLSLRQMGIATSGDYRNFYEIEGKRYSHTIDPRGGMPVEHSLASVSVLHESVAYADALATTLMVLGAKDGEAFAEKLGVAAYFIEKHSSGFTVTSTTGFLNYINR